MKTEERAERVKDKYDRDMAELLLSTEEEFERKVKLHWTMASPLFRFTGDSFNTGCLTMIKAGTDIAQTEELTLAIRADKRIPRERKNITKKSLSAFAEWQRRLDQELGEDR